MIMSYRFSLKFLANETPELCETRFSHPLISGTRRAVRGSVSISALNETTFHWSAAVHALSILAVTTARSFHSGQYKHSFPVLAGEKNSPAASLDYAISKAPAWVEEMFGSDRCGVPLIRRVILRKNPERKRPGPVVLFFCSSGADDSALEIAIDGEPVTDPSALGDLQEALEQSWCQRYEKNPSMLLDAA
jgi:hypothetical protein